MIKKAKCAPELESCVECASRVHDRLVSFRNFMTSKKTRHSVYTLKAAPLSNVHPYYSTVTCVLRLHVVRFKASPLIKVHPKFLPSENLPFPLWGFGQVE